MAVSRNSVSTRPPRRESRLVSGPNMKSTPPRIAAIKTNSSHEPTEDLSLEDYFQHFVLEHQDHMTETELARKLGVSRKCLWERRPRLGIPRRKTGVASES